MSTKTKTLAKKFNKTLGKEHAKDLTGVYVKTLTGKIARSLPRSSPRPTVDEMNILRGPDDHTAILTKK